MARQEPKLLGVEDIQRVARGYVLSRVTSGEVDFEKTAPTKIGTETLYVVEGKVKASGGGPIQRVFKMQIHGYTGKIVAMKWEAAGTKD